MHLGEQLYLQTIRTTTLLAYRRRDWREVPIVECGEPLVEVPTDMAFPYYHQEMHLTDDPRMFVRQRVLEMLQNARERLQGKRYDLRLYDGWRSIEVQENLFWHYLKQFTASKFHLEANFALAERPDQIHAVFEQLPEATQEALREANRTYVSWPSADPKHPSPHVTGGAVDVWLYQEGHPVNLGVPFDWMEEDAGAFYHLKFRNKRFHGKHTAICRNREALLLAMVRAGFSCYGPEIWHFNAGNQMDALVQGGRAKYSYVQP
ncbi:MAG: M15 family metallopeptidase [Candidatus Andersenbacteria bacterium]